MKELKEKTERQKEREALAVELQTGLDEILQALEDMNKDTNLKTETDGKVD